MAQKVNIVLVDDIDGSDAEETVSFALDGRDYEIDLSKKNAARLREVLAPYVGHEGVTHLLALARSVRALDFEDLDLSHVRAHTLVVRGDKDQWVEPGHTETLQRSIPECRLVTMENVARLIPEDAPAELAELIVDFVSPHVGKGLDESDPLGENVDAGDPEMAP